ncbi:MAG: DUF2339 domain-containing protein [Planctomycetes bacterium]|nr:DUF2339 domain-containing protein [Planctomycetota bacterium]
MLAALLVLALIASGPIALIVLMSRSRRQASLERRFAQLEARLARWEQGAPPIHLPATPSALAETLPETPILQPSPAPAAEEPVMAEILPAATPAWQPSYASPAASASSDGTSLEMFIGRRALGWVAVIVLLFATGFFLRYAFENQWIGPMGRVSLGMAAGVALVAYGYQQFRRGWVIFSRMMTAGGLVLLYLSTFSAFGFYHLLPQRDAGIFLFLVVAEGALLALAYDAWPIALMAVCGGLLTPMLMHTDQDQYQSLFTYLLVLNVGTVALLLRRRWPAVGTVSLLGTQVLFWAWYGDSYHPEKLAWALGFQFALYMLYLAHQVLVSFVRRQAADWEETARVVVNAGLWFWGAFVLLEPKYHGWMGTLAVAMALVYTLAARAEFSLRAPGRLLLATISLGFAFIAVAVGLEANTRWIACGWAVEAALLWWFGLRIERVSLRLMGIGLACLSLLRVFATLDDTAVHTVRLLVLNHNTLPALATVACLIVAIAAGGARLNRLLREEQVIMGLGFVGCLLMVMGIETADLVRYFDEQHADSLLASMSVSTWWAVYATALLVIGFLVRRPVLRWTALGVYTLTLGKVFLLDMAGLDQIYRIVAFFVLAILLGAAAWAYQRFQPDHAAASKLAKET